MFSDLVARCFFSVAYFFDWLTNKIEREVVGFEGLFDLSDFQADPFDCHALSFALPARRIYSRLRSFYLTAVLIVSQCCSFVLMLLFIV